MNSSQGRTDTAIALDKEIASDISLPRQLPTSYSTFALEMDETGCDSRRKHEVFKEIANLSLDGIGILRTR
jgi:hypothetical protein